MRTQKKKPQNKQRRPAQSAWRRFLRFWPACGRWLGYGAWLLAEVALNAGGMALDMFRPASKIYPAVLRVPLSHMTSAEVAVFATSITLTPGTLVLSIDRGTVPSCLLYTSDAADE